MSVFRRRSLPPVFPRGVGTATRRLTRFANLTNLTKNTKYSITVMASNQGGNGPPSTPTSVITSTDGKFYVLTGICSKISPL